MIAYSFKIGLFFIVLGGILALFALLPSQLPTQVADAVHFFLSSVNQWSYFLPLDTMKSVLLWAISFWTLLAVWDIANWLMSRITK